MEANKPTKPTTFWVSRDVHTRFIELHLDQPSWGLCCWHSHSSCESIEPEFHQALGLPSEPEPGRCYRVEWDNWGAHIDSVLGCHSPNLVPCVTDVTEELKEASK